jgi:hypothetical protein
MNGRSFSNENYRFGFNKYENSDESDQLDNWTSSYYRIYNAKLGTWLSTDPSFYMFPHEGAYVAFIRNPILYIDPLGDKIRYGNGTRADRKRIKSQVKARMKIDSDFKSDIKAHRKGKKVTLHINDQQSKRNIDGSTTEKVTASNIMDAEIEENTNKNRERKVLFWNVGLQEKIESSPVFTDNSSTHVGNDEIPDPEKLPKYGPPPPGTPSIRIGHPLKNDPFFNQIASYLIANTASRMLIKINYHSGEYLNYYDSDDNMGQDKRSKTLAKARKSSYNNAIRTHYMLGEYKDIRKRIDIQIHGISTDKNLDFNTIKLIYINQ